MKPAWPTAAPAARSAFAGMSRAMSTTSPMASMKAPKTRPATLFARAWSTGSRLAIFLGTATFEGFFALAGPRRRDEHGQRSLHRLRDQPLDQLAVADALELGLLRHEAQR